MNNIYFNNVNVKLPLYILLRYKKILKLLKKNIFKIINSKNMPVYIQVFNSQFVNKIKNNNINNAFKKFYLVV